MVTKHVSTALAASTDRRSLDEQIAEAEEAILLADSRIDQRVDDLKQSLKAQTGKLVAGAFIAAAGVGLLIWRPWEGRRHRAKARRRAQWRGERDARRSRRGHDNDNDGDDDGFDARSKGWSLFSLIGLLWPLLPFRLPSPVGPKMTAFLLAMGLPLAAKPEDVDVRPPPLVHAGFDPARYCGRWYEIARLPMSFESGCVGDVTASYARLADASDEFSVINRCRNVEGRLEVARGLAKLPDPGSPAKLKVTFAPAFMRPLPFVWADYWVLHVDADYSVAVVGTPDRKNLWLLAREPKIDDSVFEQLAEIAAAQGFDLAALIRTLQMP